MTFLNEGAHLLPSQLAGEHTGHKTASKSREPIWNAHYFSTHCHCWYSFYLPTEGCRVESTPSQVESGVSGYWTQDLSNEGLLVYQLHPINRYATVASLVLIYLWIQYLMYSMFMHKYVNMCKYVQICVNICWICVRIAILCICSIANAEMCISKPCL